MLVVTPYQYEVYKSISNRVDAIKEGVEQWMYSVCAGYNIYVPKTNTHISVDPDEQVFVVAVTLLETDDFDMVARTTCGIRLPIDTEPLYIPDMVERLLLEDDKQSYSDYRAAMEKQKEFGEEYQEYLRLQKKYGSVK